MPLRFPIRPNRNGLVLGAALLIGVLAALGARHYLNSQMAAMQVREPVDTVQVIVAKADLTRGTRLSTDNLAVRAIPRSYAHSVALTPEQYEHVAGQVLAYPVKSGEMILWGLLEGKRVPTFSARVETGRRAMTVPVDEISSISGLLEPGDFIDLMLTFDREGRKVTLPLLQNVQVMATGQRAVDDPRSGERRHYSTVTLDTTPEQAQRVIVAREAGKITALLRNPQDRAPLDGQEVDIARLFGAGPPRPPALASAARDIPVLYGGRAGQLSGDALRLNGGEEPITTQAARELASGLREAMGQPDPRLAVRSPSMGQATAAASGPARPPGTASMP